MCFDALLLHPRARVACWSAGALSPCPAIPEAAAQTCSGDRPQLVGGKNAVDKSQLICGLMENSLGHFI